MSIVKKYLYPVLVISGFSMGAWTWKILNNRQSNDRLLRLQEKINQRAKDVLVNINGTTVKKEDIDFEFRVLTMNLNEEDISSIPSISPGINPTNQPLNENIIDSLVERKMLYQIILKDEHFSINNPARYTDCLQNWVDATKANQGLFKNPGDKDRLKSRLCEQSLLNQYLSEKVFRNISISDQDIHHYYIRNKNEFFRPMQVSIRQIVLADERKARRIKSSVNRHNFSTMARSHSITPEAQSGGLLPPFSTGYGMPRFFDVAFSMRPGQISDILKSTYGFHIIMLEKKIQERFLGPDEAAPLIRDKLLNREKERAYQKWVDFALHSIRISTPGMLW